jgi:predicted MPP superfamily phosphohydrolase
MAQQPFTLLVISDVHYAPGRADAGDLHVAMGKELLRRAIDDALRRGGFDAIALAGDLLNEPDAPDAEQVLAELRAEIADAAGDAPLLLAPGNHDGDPARILAALNLDAGPREINGYRFFTFADRFAAGDFAERSETDRRVFREFAAASGGPIVTIQHNPIHPDVPETDYPYMLTNRRDVMDDYTRAGVVLSISGHYHAGGALDTQGGVRYFTAPALSEDPFNYTMVTLIGEQVRIEPRRLLW